MSDFFDEITIIGFTPASGEVRALIEKVDGVGATDLLPALDALGEGEYCGRLDLFSRFAVRPLADEQFVKEQVPGWERAIEVGSDESGRCIALAANADGCSFYIVDWKHDEVMAHLSFEACLQGLNNLSGLGHLCRCPFHLGPRVIKVVFDVPWNFDIAVGLVKRAMPDTDENREYCDGQEYWQMYAKGLGLFIEVSAGDDQKCTWYCPEEQSRETSRICDRWFALARGEGLDVPVIAYGDWG